MEELFRSTKVEALPIGLWPKLVSVTSNAEPGFKSSRHSALTVRLSYCHDKMIETTEMISLFSLFWEHLEAHCFHYFHWFHCFHCSGSIWKLTVFTVLEKSGSSLFSLFSDWLPYKTVRKNSIPQTPKLISHTSNPRPLNSRPPKPKTQNPKP
jgi:hypothetical protein